MEMLSRNGVREALTAGLFQIQLLNPFASPRCLAQKFQAGFDAGVMREAAHGNGGGHRVPTEVLGQLCDDGFKRDAV